jgi:hypothetical protein
MDWKTVVIAVLVASAVLLGGVVMSGLRPEPAYGQGGVYSTYLAVTANVQSDFVNYVVLDTEARRMLCYRVDTAKLTMEPAWGADLVRDFRHPGAAAAGTP